MSKKVFDIQMPDGTIISGVPEGTTAEDVQKLYESSKASKATSTPEYGQKLKKSVDESALRIGGGLVGGALGAIYGGPSGAALGASITDYVARQALGDTKPQLQVPFTEPTELPDIGGSVGNAIVDVGTNSILNYGIGKGLEKAFKLGRGIVNLFGESGIPETTLKLKPTYGQLNPQGTVSKIEDLLLRHLKEQHVERSIELSKDEASNISAELAGVKKTNLATVPTGTKQTYAAAAESLTDKAFKSFVAASNAEAENVRNIARTKIKNIPVITPGKPTGLVRADGLPVAGNPSLSFIKVEGPTPTKNIVDKALEIKNELESIATKPDPQSPLLRDLNAIIDNYGIFDKDGHLTGYKDINFKDAWAQKIDLSDKGWGNPNRADISIVDSRYKDLYKAMSKDLDNGVNEWGAGTNAPQSYANARKLVAARNALFEGYSTQKILNLQDLKEPSEFINKIVDNSKELSKFLLQNEYKLPNGSVITGGNKRGILKSYQFMRMWDDANKLTDAGNIKGGKVNVDNFINTWNKFKTSQNAKTLYNTADVKRIDDFTNALRTVTSMGDTAGASRYLGVRLATGGFHLGVASIAGAGAITGSMIATGALAGMVLTARQVGKILLNNPDAAEVLTKMALGKPLGRSAQGAAQILSYALRNEDVLLETNEGTQIGVKIDGTGKIVPQIANTNNLPRVEIVNGLPTKK